ncbi:hypothetical protein ABT297_03950 [Dactylosporangium sp. NPDC000555]|uniref:hypothetical protein n=1 Tax=Dactylosporangium sp. NPDC000555 TaxID=3154260 RepID=UPI00331DE8FA
MTTYREQSEYRQDPRVQWPAEGWLDGVIAALPDWVDERNSRVVLAVDEHVVVRGLNSDDATLYDQTDRHNTRLWLFASVDEALRTVHGEPWRSVLTHEEFVTAAQAGMPVPSQVDCRITLERDPATLALALAEAIAWIIWQGGAAIPYRWPCTPDGMAAAEQWAASHAALGRDGYPIREGELLRVLDYA